MNRDRRREAEKDIMKMPKQDILEMYYQMMKMVADDEITMEEFEEHKKIISKAWKKKFGTEILLDQVLTNMD